VCLFLCGCAKTLQHYHNSKILETKENHPLILKTEAMQSMVSVQYNAIECNGLKKKNYLQERMNQLRRTTQPTTNGPISPLRMARATSLATNRQVDTQPASTAHTMSTMQTATLHGIVILAPPQPPPRRQFHEHRPCNPQTWLSRGGDRMNSEEFMTSSRKRTHLLSCLCRQHARTEINSG